jgi:RNA recognition motif-containing protein
VAPTLFEQEKQEREVKPWFDKNLSAAQLKDREARTVFVGNVALGCKRKSLKTFFADCGVIESVWLRSVPIENELKGSIKGHVIQKKFKDGATNMNAYVLFDGLYFFFLNNVARPQNLLSPKITTN